MEMAGHARILYGSEHVVSEALDGEYVAGKSRPLHGETVALGTILMTSLQGGDWKAVKKALQEIGAPVTADEIDYDDGAVIRALVSSRGINEQWLKRMPYFHSVLLEKPLLQDSAERLARETGVIQ